MSGSESGRSWKFIRSLEWALLIGALSGLAFIGLTFSNFLLEMERQTAIYVGIGIGYVIEKALGYMVIQTCCFILLQTFKRPTQLCIPFIKISSDESQQRTIALLPCLHDFCEQSSNLRYSGSCPTCRLAHAARPPRSPAEGPIFARLEWYIFFAQTPQCIIVY